MRTLNVSILIAYYCLVTVNYNVVAPKRYVAKFLRDIELYFLARLFVMLASWVRIQTLKKKHEIGDMTKIINKLAPKQSRKYFT